MQKPCANINLDINFEINGKISVFQRQSGKTYVIGPREYSVLRELDGKKDLNEIATHTDYSENEIACLIQQFEKLGFLNNYNAKTQVNPICIKKPLVNGNELINPEKVYWRVIYFLILYCSFPLFILGLAVNAGKVHQLLETVQTNLMQPSAIIVLPITLLVLTLHEMGHAVVARCLNVNVPEIGVMLYWFMPCAYTNLSGIYFLNKRTHRLLSLFAGLFVNVMLSGIGLLMLPVTDGILNEFFLWFAISNLSIIFANLVVFLKLDGYFILEECVGMKNLRGDSFAFVRNSINSFFSKVKMDRKRKLKYRTVMTKESVTFTDKIIYIFYASFSGIYVFLLLILILSTAIALIMEWIL